MCRWSIQFWEFHIYIHSNDCRIVTEMKLRNFRNSHVNLSRICVDISKILMVFSILRVQKFHKLIKITYENYNDFKSIVTSHIRLFSWSSHESTRWHNNSRNWRVVEQRRRNRKKEILFILFTFCGLLLLLFSLIRRRLSTTENLRKIKYRIFSSPIQHFRDNKKAAKMVIRYARYVIAEIFYCHPISSLYLFKRMTTTTLRIENWRLWAVHSSMGSWDSNSCRLMEMEGHNDNDETHSNNHKFMKC